MKKVAYYCISTHLGGAERSLLEFLLQLKQSKDSGIHPWVVVPKDSGPLLEALHEAGIPFDVLLIPPSVLQISRTRPFLSLLKTIQGAGSLILYFKKFCAILRDAKPALLHTTGIKCHLLGAMAGFALGIPVLWHLRDTLDRGFTPGLLRMFRFGLHPFVIANSSYTARTFSKQVPVPVIYNGLDGLRYHRIDGTQFRIQAGIPLDVPLIGMVGVFARWKGQIQFVEMASRIKDLAPTAHFVLVGSEIYDTTGEKGMTEEIRQVILRTGMENQIHLTGFSKNICEALSAMNIVVHASLRPEPFGRVVLEAMACGVPVVAANAGGIPEIIQHEKNGLLYPPGSINHMAELVMRLLRDQVQMEKLAQAGLHTVQCEFSIQVHMERLLKIYADIFNQSLSKNPSS